MDGFIASAIKEKCAWHLDVAVPSEIKPTPVVLFSSFGHSRGHNWHPQDWNRLMRMPESRLPLLTARPELAWAEGLLTFDQQVGVPWERREQLRTDVYP
jgi:hypothetical protein